MSIEYTSMPPGASQKIKGLPYYGALRLAVSRFQKRRPVANPGEVYRMIIEDVSPEVARKFLSPLTSLGSVNSLRASEQRKAAARCVAQNVEHTILATQLGLWLYYGSRQFQLSPLLQESFLRSDIEGLAIEQFQFPYPGFYIQFASNLALHANGQEIDGVFVGHFSEMSADIAVAASHLRLVFCTRTANKQFDTVTLNIRSHFFKLPLEAAVTAALEEDRIEQQRTHANSPLSATAGALFCQSNDANREQLIQWTGLVLNALAYIGGYEDDKTWRWPTGTPHKLAHEFQMGTQAQKQRAQAHLDDLSIVPLRYVGAQFEKGQRGVESAGGIAAHWRRGHWAYQVHGPERSLRKLIWRKPVRVNVENPSEDAS